MQKRQGQLLLSATDLVHYLECEHLTALDLINLETPLPKAPDDEQAVLIQDKGQDHEADYAESLRNAHADFVDISSISTDLDERCAATRAAMERGAAVIFQAALRDGMWLGYADFLIRVERPSQLGAYSYEVSDTKLARSPKAKFLIQLAFYSDLVSNVQGTDPLSMYVVLGDGRQLTYRYADYAHYFKTVLREFADRLSAGVTDTYPEPVAHCELCRWRLLCAERWVKDDHLSQVANIARGQIRKLTDAGVMTLETLATLPADKSVPKMATGTLAKLRHQASLQLRARQTGEPVVELLNPDPEGIRGFSRLPAPDDGDLFFDMEGDPLEDGGLEYLFGVYYFKDGEPEFLPFWGHTRQEEKLAFEAFMDFVTAHLAGHPQAHIYHYAPYEPTALKRLMSLHGTREAEVDALLRQRKLIDLFQVVRESIRVSEPRYSLKNIELFFRGPRGGDVKSAGASVVYYERWKATGDTAILKEIEDYNREDVVSTFDLRQWLLGLRPAGTPWRSFGLEDTAPDNRSDKVKLREQELVGYREQLVDPLPADRAQWESPHRLKELAYQLLDFHRRADKPAWWAMFSRQDLTDDELLDDVECLAGLVLDKTGPPTPVKKSLVWTYHYPEQETKFKDGDNGVIVQTLENVTNMSIDEGQRRVTIKRGANRDPIPERFSLSPGKPLDNDVVRDAVQRFTDSVVDSTGRYRALESFLTHSLPRIHGMDVGSFLIDEGEAPLPQAADVVSRMDHTHLFIQGPPGAGKTYTGSHLIVALLQSRKRIAVTSNSHKAINNLLSGVEAVAREQGFAFRGAKKASRGNPDSEFDTDNIESIYDYDELGNAFDLVAGTAWVFSRPEHDQQFDYLFVDEAGQVAVANLVAMGICAKNIVLLGDQMQLGQPIQGVHPGRSGESSLEYLLNGQATIPPEQGIFLKTTWRMHPDVCRFISDAVYDGRLEPEPANARQALLLDNSAHPALRATGIRYLPIEHEGCSQRSPEEAALVNELVDNLLGQRYADKNGNQRPLILDDILIVSPYNMQVNLLKQTLPAGARVGTVDKFQGQEAPVVIVSMATSSGEDLPRHIEFLFSKNRLNVAISRAKCLALFIANPQLMSIRCNTPEQMALVNTLCWVKEYSGSVP